MAVCSSADFNQVLFVNTMIVVHKGNDVAESDALEFAAFKANDLPAFGLITNPNVNHTAFLAAIVSLCFSKECVESVQALPPLDVYFHPSGGLARVD